jgi:tRNA pseudouridine55 synthase
LNGILLIDKPEGPTSADVVRRVGRLLPSTRIGHLGTLDPFASGLLPLCVGEGTKIAPFLSAADKEYEGLIRLGVATDTGDRTGKPVRTSGITDVTDLQLREIAQRFHGEYHQVPPMYSALKRNGVPLYKLARQGIEVERKARLVHIASLEIACEQPGRLRFRVSCSKGTYVRVLAEDIGESLGSAAHLESLRRTRFGGFELSDAVPLEAWSPDNPAGWVTIRRALVDLPTVVLDERQTAAVRQGQSWVLGQVGPLPRADYAVLLDPTGGIGAVIANRGGRWVFARVLRAEEDSLQGSDPMLGKDVKQTEKRWR